MDNSILRFERWLQHKYLNETLGVSDDVVKLSSYLYSFLKDKLVGKYDIDNLPTSLPIKNIIVNIAENYKYEAGINIDKSFEKNGQWTIYFKLGENFSLATIQHEIHHMLQLIHRGKKDILNKISYIKSGFLLQKLDITREFFENLYLSSDEEINSMVSEAHVFIEESFYQSGINIIDSEKFMDIIKETRSYEVSQQLINYNIHKTFKKFNKDQINKFFSLLENNKKDFDKIFAIKYTFFKKISILIKIIRDALDSDMNFDIIYTDDCGYIPKRGINYYGNWIKSQGEKLQRKLFKMYDLFNK